MKKTILIGLAIICILSMGMLTACQRQEQTAQEKIETLRHQFDNIRIEINKQIAEGPEDIKEQLRLLNEEPLVTKIDALNKIILEIKELQEDVEEVDRADYNFLCARLMYEYNEVKELKEAYENYDKMTDREKFLLDMKIQVIRELVNN